MRPAVFVGAAVIAGTALWVGQLRLADAGCPGGGGGGGGTGGGGGGGGGSYGGRSWHAAPGCEDDSDVVGFRRCTRFAAWGRNLRFPHIIIEAGAAVRQFGSLLDQQTGSVSHGSESFSYRVLSTVTRSRAVDTAVVSMMRAGIGLSHGLYTGLELDLGAVTQPAAAATEMMSSGTFGAPDLRQERGFLVDSFGVFGVHGATGSGGLGLELAAGMRAVSYSFHSSYHDCEQTTSVGALAPVAEVRARGELWLSPWLTAGVVVGASVIERSTWMGGVYLGVHSRAFGGER